MIIFPLYPVARDADGNPFCPCPKQGCTGYGKHPRVYDWTNLKESVDLGDAEGWGLLTNGEVFVFDVDKKNGGLENFEKLTAGREWPKTYTVRSGGGGFHAYFKRPEGVTIASSIGKIAPGIDILGEGKYVVGAGSPHASGGRYELEIEAPFADAPAWLLAWIAANPGNAGKKVVSESWTPVERTDPTYPDRVKEQAEFFKRSSVFKSGKGKHRYVLLLQNAGPGLLLDEETTVQNFKEYYDPRLPEGDRWFPDHEEEFQGEIIRRAWACTMSEGKTPNALWVQRSFFAAQEKKVKESSAKGEQELGSRTPAANAKKKTLTDAAQFLASHDDWKGVWRYDEFKDAIVAVKPPMRLDAEKGGELTKEDVTLVRAWYEFREYVVSHETVEMIIRTLAKQSRFHPVREYLASLPVRGLDVFDGLSSRLFGSPAETKEHDDFVLRKFFTAAYARVACPGIKQDTILVLYGPQGYKKSTFVQEMFAPWYRDQMPDLANRDGSMALEGYWGIELGELDKMQKLETSTVKDFLSRSTDRYRGFGTKDKVERPRQCVFVGTTNDDEFLQDITGNRRFWIVQVRKHIPTVTEAQRSDIWAGARTCYEYGERHWLDEDEEKVAEGVRKGFEISDPWENKVGETLIRVGKAEVTTAEVLEKLFTIGAPDLKSINGHSMKRVARCLKALGWTQKRTKEKRFWEKELPETNRVVDISNYRK